MSADPNRLLFAISVRGRMTWAQFCEAVDLLAPPSSRHLHENGGAATRRCLLQSLQALGHCDALYEEGNSTIVVTPPSACRLPKAGLPLAVLTGARYPQTKEQLIQATRKRGREGRLSILPYPGPLGLLPDTILIESDSEEAMTSFFADLQIPYSAIAPAWTMVNWSGTLSEFAEILDYRIPENLNYPRYDFCIQSLYFSRSKDNSFPRFTRYRNPTTGLPHHIYFRDTFGAEVDLNWGRFLILRSKEIVVTAYDEKRFRLCVPVKTPLPVIVSRALCLCSGKPPVPLHREFLVRGLDCSIWLCFENVPPQIAIAALSRVGQHPERVEIQ